MSTRAVLGAASACAAVVLLVHCSSSDGESNADTGDGGGSEDGSGTSVDGGPSGADGGGDGATGTDAGADAWNGFTLGGCPIFGPNFAYNRDVSQAPLDAKSATYLADLKARAPVIGLDYPGGEGYNVVPASQAMVPVQTSAWLGWNSGTFFFTADAGAATAPIPPGVKYEEQGVANADHHMMVLQQGTCRLYELYAWNPTSDTTGWSALVEWDLHADEQQIPDSLEINSTTAAGTPLLPGVIWPEEVAAGAIKHAIDIVMPQNAISKCSYVHPASDGAWNATGTFPYGGRLRLKANYDMSKITGKQARVVLEALQKYGMFNTDISGETRSSFRLGGLGANQGWDQTDISQLGTLTWDDFEVVDLGTVYTMKGCP